MAAMEELVNVISVRGVVHPGTAQNKSSSSSTLMCGSSAAGEPLPIHLMFASDAAKDEFFLVNAECISNIPHAFVLFSLDEKKSLGATVTVNPKKGTHIRVLAQVQ